MTAVSCPQARIRTPAVYRGYHVEEPGPELAEVLAAIVETRRAWLAADAAVREAFRNSRPSPFEGAEDTAHGSKDVAAILAAQDARDRAHLAYGQADADARGALARWAVARGRSPGSTPFFFLPSLDTFLRLDWTDRGIGNERWVIDTPEAREERAGKEADR